MSAKISPVKSLWGVLFPPAPPPPPRLLRHCVPPRGLKAGNVRPVGNLVSVSSRTKTYGERAIVVADPTLWNAVPVHIRNSPTIAHFKTQLKTHLFKGVLHPRALFLKTLCIFSRNKATSDKVSYGSGQKRSKKLKNHSFTSVETIVVKLQWKIYKNQYFPCFEP